MNITSLEIAQATMDMFFCLFCLIIFVSIKANNPKQKSMRMFVRLLLIATVLFFGETLAYIFRGNLGLFNVSIIACVNVIQQVTKENSEIQSRTIAQMVSAKIENEFIKPITVSQTISSDIDIRTYQMMIFIISYRRMAVI